MQGPYRLEGAQGERFILVVPGSEVVYLDGLRLVRGETNDYTIDYATGEITFTPQRLITSDRRITAEFQYTTNQFTRTIVASQAQAGFWQREDGTARAHLGATFLREADSRQFSEAFDLTAADSLLLRETGDRPAFRSGAERVVFDPEAPYVQYVREPVLGGEDTAFVALDAAPLAGTPVYRFVFPEWGRGRGGTSARAAPSTASSTPTEGRVRGITSPSVCCHAHSSAASSTSEGASSPCGGWRCSASGRARSTTRTGSPTSAARTTSATPTSAASASGPSR